MTEKVFILTGVAQMNQLRSFSVTEEIGGKQERLQIILNIFYGEIIGLLVIKAESFHEKRA